MWFWPRDTGMPMNASFTRGNLVVDPAKCQPAEYGIVVARMPAFLAWYVAVTSFLLILIFLAAVFLLIAQVAAFFVGTAQRVRSN